MIVDAHVHYTPPELRVHLDEFIRDEPYWGLLMGGPNSVQGWASAERMIEDMDRAEVDKVLLMGDYRRQHAGCVARNDEALAIVRRYPGRIMPFAMVQPKAGQAALDELARCIDTGMVGVGELGPYGQGYRLDDPDFLRVVEACINRDVPINLHVNEEVGHYYGGKAATPLLHIYQLAERYPELKLILAHWGGGLLFYELMPEVQRVLRNVWYDTAASPLLYPTERIFRAALAAVDHRKLLYGSDYPLRVYPRIQKEPDFQPFLAEIEALGLPPGQQSDLLGGNAARLLGLQPDDRPMAPSTHKRKEEMIVRIASDQMPEIVSRMAVAAVAVTWPQTQCIFERHGIPWRDSPVPYWEPITQAAAARGLGPDEQARLLAELNEAMGGREAD